MPVDSIPVPPAWRPKVTEFITDKRNEAVARIPADAPNRQEIIEQINGQPEHRVLQEMLKSIILEHFQAKRARALRAEMDAGQAEDEAVLAG